MPPENTIDLLRHSVTRDDSHQYDGGGNVIRFFLPSGYAGLYGSLPSELPPYWSPARDSFLRATVFAEALWGSAVGIAGTKTASLSFEIEGEVGLRVRRAQEMMLNTGRNGYVSEVTKGVADYL